MTAPLSYTSQFGYYGLRVNPSFDKVLGTVRKPLRIPLPDRSSKWYALSPYRALILDAAQKYNDWEAAKIDYRNSGAHAPESVVHTQPSEAGNDPMFQEVDRQNQAADEQDAYELALEAMNAEHRQQAQAIRQQQLSTYGPNRMNPTIEAHHPDLEQARVAHAMPAPRQRMVPYPWPAPPMQMAAAGQPQAPEFPTFENLNMGQPARVYPAHLRLRLSEDPLSYDQVRSQALGS